MWLGGVTTTVAGTPRETSETIIVATVVPALPLRESLIWICPPETHVLMLTACRTEAPLWTFVIAAAVMLEYWNPVKFGETLTAPERPLSLSHVAPLNTALSASTMRAN